MADQINYSPEQLDRINELLNVLDLSPKTAFFPMADQFNSDISPYLTAEEREALNPTESNETETPDSGADSSAEMSDTTDLGNLGGLDDSTGLGDLGGLDDSTGLGDLGDLGDSTGLGDLSDSGDSADLGNLGDLGDSAGLGDLGDPGDSAGLGDLGDLDDSADLGDLGDSADLGNLGDLGDSADLGNLGDLGDSTGLGDLGDLGDSAGLGDLGDLGDSAGLGDLGDLGDSADLGNLGDLGDSAGLADLGDLGDSAGLGDLGDLGDSAGLDDLGNLGNSAGLGDLGDLGDSAGLGDLGGLGDSAGLGDLGDPGDSADLGDLGGFGSSSDTATPNLTDTSGFDDFGGIDDIPDINADTSSLPSDFDDLPDLGGLETSLPEDSGFPSADELSSFDTSNFDSGLGLDTSDLADMSQTAMMSTGIGDEFNDEELAKLRSQLLDYAPGVRKSVIDIIVNEKISTEDQRLLTQMIVDQASDDAVASFIEQRLNYRPDTSLPDRTRDGVQILYTEDVTPEAMGRRRRRAFLAIGSVVGVILAAVIGFGTLKLMRYFSISAIYDEGLNEIVAAESEVGEAKLKRRNSAEEHYNRALKADDYNYNIEYMNKYGLAYMKAGFYEDAFTKLFGKVQPEYDWTGTTTRAPLINTTPDSRWFTHEEQVQNYRTKLTSADQKVRELVEPGAYTVSRLRDKKMDESNLIALARFHSGITYSFVNSDEGKKYKNDSLAIDYYRLILTLLNQPDNLTAMAGIGRIYYNRGEYGTASREYQKILDLNPAAISGHSGLLETFIEIWRQNGDPRFVIEKHRQMQRLGIEKDIPIFILTKLAGFYIDLNQDDLRIRYQVDPVDTASGLDLDDNAIHLLGLIFDKTEKRDDDTIDGNTYAAAYFQRGRYLNVKKEYKRAVKQFQNAFQYDSRFYPALNSIGDYYARILDFERAQEYYQKSIESYEANYQSYGKSPEDELLIQFDRGLIYYNLASLVFYRYAGIDDKELPKLTRIYPESETRDESTEDDNRRRRLYQANIYLEKSIEEGLQKKEARQQALFWLGWIPYIQGDFKEAMRRFSELEREYDETNQSTNISFGMANAAFHTEQYRTALGHYLKLRDELELALQGASPQDERLKMKRYLLYSVYNNLGAVYETNYVEKLNQGASRKELDKLQTKGLTNYLKAIDVAKDAGFIPELAMANRELAFRATANHEPMIEDWLNPVVGQQPGEQ